MKALAAARSSPSRHGTEHRKPELFDLGPFGAAFLPQEMEGDGLDQHEAFHAVSERARGFERQRRAVRMADEMQLAFRLLGQREEDVHDRLRW